MDIRIIPHRGKEYEEMVTFRTTFLLEPIGVPATYIDRGAEAEDILIGAFADDRMIGCCVLSRRDQDTVQLRQMAVRDDMRLNGIGKAILEFAEYIALNNGYNILMMHARDPVLPFYQKCGYAVSGEEFSEVGIPHHRMHKELV